MIINAVNERTYVKFHFKTAQGIRNFIIEETAKMKSHDMNLVQRDFFLRILWREIFQKETCRFKS
ncbi:catalase [Flavobacterium sp. DSR3-2]|uniref:catalase n=1 Tax=Flavobacterium sp. DSR3-2 TaxID=2804634 RepID=UPI003CFB2C74